MQLGSVTVDDYIGCLLRSTAARYNAPAHLVVATAYYASAFNPQSVHAFDPDGAYGLLGIYRQNPVGYGRSNEELLDPRNNLNLGVPVIAYADTTHGDIDDADTPAIFLRVIESAGFYSVGAREHGDPESVIADALRAVSTDGNGFVFDWPAYNPDDCGGIPPPPPLGVWCEPFPPTDDTSIDDLITAHAERMEALWDGTY